MSRGIAVSALDSAGGQQLGGGQNFFVVDGQSVVLVGDAVLPHGPLKHKVPFMAEGSGWMTLNGTPVCCAGNQASCGHPTTGRPWFGIAA